MRRRTRGLAPARWPPRLHRPGTSPGAARRPGRPASDDPRIRRSLEALVHATGAPSCDAVPEPRRAHPPRSERGHHRPAPAEAHAPRGPGSSGNPIRDLTPLRAGRTSAHRCAIRLLRLSRRSRRSRFVSPSRRRPAGRRPPDRDGPSTRLHRAATAAHIPRALHRERSSVARRSARRWRLHCAVVRQSLGRGARPLGARSRTAAAGGHRASASSRATRPLG